MLYHTSAQSDIRHQCHQCLCKQTFETDARTRGWRVSLDPTSGHICYWRSQWNRSCTFSCCSFSFWQKDNPFSWSDFHGPVHGTVRGQYPTRVEHDFIYHDQYVHRLVPLFHWGCGLALLSRSMCRCCHELHLERIVPHAHSDLINL